MPDAVWFILAILLLIGAVVLGAWALFWDRPRGRLRCPKCQYRMEGIAVSTVTRKGKQLTGHVCPECGSVSAFTTKMLYTRCRWRLALVVPLLLLAAHVASKVPEIQSRTWRAAVPTPLLVSMWPVAFLIDDPVGSDELAARTDWTWLRPVERLWVNRLCKYQLDQLQSNRDPKRPALYSRTYDLRVLWTSLHIDEAADRHTYHGCALGSIDRSTSPFTTDAEHEKAMWIAETSQRILDALSMLVDAEDWNINGGDGGTIFAWGSHIVAIEDDATLEKLDRFVAQFKQVVQKGAGASEQCEYLSPRVAIFNEDDLRLDDQNECYGAQYKRQELAGVERGHFIGTTVSVISFENDAVLEAYRSALNEARSEQRRQSK